MNNTKAIVRDIGRHLVTVETLMERRQFILPHITFRFTLPWIIERRQFPLQLCYAITVNKSQGQILDRICLDLREHPFTHGQLYVGASHVKNRSNILGPDAGQPPPSWLCLDEEHCVPRSTTILGSVVAKHSTRVLRGKTIVQHSDREVR